MPAWQAQSFHNGLHHPGRIAGVPIALKKESCSIVRRAFFHEVYRGISHPKGLGERRDYPRHMPGLYENGFA
jgi:hypothetical protein